MAATFAPDHFYPAGEPIPVACCEARDLMRHWLKVANNPHNNRATIDFAVAEADHWRQVANRIEAERGELA